MAIDLTALSRGRRVRAPLGLLYGPEGCLDGGSFVQYEIRNADGARRNHRGGTIRRLYERFHGVVASGRGNNRPLPPGCTFTVPSINEEGRVFHNRVRNVVSTGVKQCFRVVTESGAVLEATGDHKFHVGTGYKATIDLRVGDPLQLHDSTPHRNGSARLSEQRPHVYVKDHPTTRRKVVKTSSGDYAYKVLPRSRAVVEADMNDLPFVEYIERLNAGDLEGLDFLSPSTHVHHEDEDFTNDALENLVALDGREHNRQHALERHNDLRFVVRVDPIVSIEEVGTRETFDIQVEGPHNNYVAGGLVVHNSGKTSFCAGAPDVLFLRTEDGLGTLEVPRLPADPEDGGTGTVQSFPELIEYLTAIHAAKPAELSARTIVIDSISALEPLIWKHVCEQHGVSSIEAVMGGYSKGYTEALREWQTFVAWCKAIRDDTGRAVVLIGHSIVQRHEDPENESYDQFVPDIHKRARALILRAMEFVGFLNWRTVTSQEEQGFGKTRTRATNQIRMLYTSRRPAFSAKNRWNLPPEIQLSEDPLAGWGIFTDAITEGLKAQPTAAAATAAS